jgi:DNA invertase Pin-like site-specific DNA recombinase
MGARKAGDESFHSERDQKQALQHAAKELGGTLKLLPSELDVSGGLPLEKRPSLLAAVEGVEKGKYAGIIVAYHSRLGRDVETEEAVWRRVEAAGGRIVMALDGLDTSTTDGQMVRRIRSAINHAERSRHVENFDRRRREATAAGIWQRRQTPTGYRKEPKTRKLVPDRDAQKVRDAFHARAAGEPMVQIARSLGMSPAGARALLKNRVYLGELRVGQYVNPDAHEPLITVDEYDAAQVARPVRPARSKGERALLAGLARCAGCGHVMSRTHAKAIVYTCHRHHSNGMCPAPASVTLHLLDAHVERIALAHLAGFASRPVANEQPIRLARERVREAEAELRAFLEGVSAAGISPTDYANAAKTRSQAVTDAKAELETLLRERPTHIPGDPVKVWEAASVSQRNQLLRGFLEAVLVERSGGRGVIRPLADRVRVLKLGAGMIPVDGRGGVPVPIESIALPAADDPCVLGVDLGQ